MLYFMMILFSFFAAYGIVQMIYQSIFSYRTKHGETAACLHTVVGLKDAEEGAEGLLRTLIWQEQFGELIVLDFGSEDDTGEILKNMELKYPSIHVMHPEEYISYLRAVALTFQKDL